MLEMRLMMYFGIGSRRIVTVARVMGITLRIVRVCTYRLITVMANWLIVTHWNINCGSRTSRIACHRSGVLLVGCWIAIVVLIARSRRRIYYRSICWISIRVALFSSLITTRFATHFCFDVCFFKKFYYSKLLT